MYVVLFYHTGINEMAKKNKYRRKKLNTRKHRRFRKKFRFDIKKLKKKLKPDKNLLKLVPSWMFKIALVCLFAFVFVWYYSDRESVWWESL